MAIITLSKKTIILFFAILLCSTAFAQTIGIASFELKETDLTANLKETTVRDQNGDKCALIKILTTQRGFTFDVGTLGVTKTEEHPSQIWVYVPHGIRKISIYHPTLGSLVDWPIPIAIESAMTYQMKITSDEVVTVVRKKMTMDFLIIRPVPADALVFINGEPLENQNGAASKFLPFGTYEYRIEAQNYRPYVGKVTLDGKKDIEVKLTPAFGYLMLQGTELDGATLRIDNKQVSFRENQRVQLSSGNHDVLITREFCRPFSKKVTISDGNETSLPVQFAPDYSNVTINVRPDVEIVVNGKSYGKGKWHGKMMAGAYRIEGKCPGHKDVVTEITISGTLDSRAITLEENIPIYGSLVINTTPIDCIVEIDGKNVGATPLALNEVLTGKHELRVSKKGYVPVTRILTISEQTTETCSLSLKKAQEVPAAASVGMSGRTRVNSDVTVAADGSINGYKYVDLGLSVKWATCNIGASRPEEYGRYFAWGGVVGQTWDGTKWSGSGFSTKQYYILDASKNLRPGYDAARVNLGGSWRMPTHAEQQELIANCTCTWTNNYNGTGVAGRIFTGKKAGYTNKSIFLPAAGNGYRGNLNFAGSYGGYWSSTLSGGNYAWRFYFVSGDVNTGGLSVGSCNCVYGQSIRPVSE